MGLHDVFVVLMGKWYSRKPTYPEWWWFIDKDIIYSHLNDMIIVNDDDKRYWHTKKNWIVAMSTDTNI